MLRHFLGVMAPQPGGIAGEMGIDGEAGIFQTLRSYSLHHHTDHFSQPAGQAQGLVVGINPLLHRLGALA